MELVLNEGVRRARLALIKTGCVRKRVITEANCGKGCADWSRQKDFQGSDNGPMFVELRCNSA